LEEAQRNNSTKFAGHEAASQRFSTTKRIRPTLSKWYRTETKNLTQVPTELTVKVFYIF